MGRNFKEVAVLLQKEKLIFMRMNGYKSDEMAWLKFFIIWYSGLCIYLLSKLPNQTVQGIDSTYLLLTLSQITTVAFVFLLWHIRKNYYEKHCEGFRIRQELDKVVSGFVGQADWSNEMDSTKWRLYTKPFNSFLMRMLFVIGANCAVFALAAFTKKVTAFQPVVVIGGAISMNLTVVAVVYFFDLHHFTKKRG